MLKHSSKNFREFFLLEFTKEIIRGTEKYKELFIGAEVREALKHHNLERELIEKHKLKKGKILNKFVRDKLEEESKRISHLKKEESLPEFRLKEPFSKSKSHILPTHSSPKKFRPRMPPPLKIPEFMLPQTVSQIMPSPLPGEIDIGKLNILARDPLVKEIECNGPDEKIIVRGAMGRKSTNITLTKEEIDEIIDRFSQVSRIPLSTGVFKVVYGRFVLSAIISEVVDAKFIIRKMANPQPRMPISR